MSELLHSIYHDVKLAIEVMKDNADNETLTGAGVDMLGYEGVAFVLQAEEGEIASLSMKAQQDTDVAFGTAADLLGTATACATTVAARGLAVLDIYQPKERYVRPIVTVPDWTAKAVSVLSIRYGGRIRPETNTGEFHQSPAEGTA